MRLTLILLVLTLLLTLSYQLKVVQDRLQPTRSLADKDDDDEEEEPDATEIIKKDFEEINHLISDLRKTIDQLETERDAAIGREQTAEKKLQDKIDAEEKAKEAEEAKKKAEEDAKKEVEEDTKKDDKKKDDKKKDDKKKKRRVTSIPVESGTTSTNNGGSEDSG